VRVLVTGSASHLARVLLPRLCLEADVSQVLGVDLRASGFRHAKYTEVQDDVRSPELGRHLRGVDAVIHLAFVVLPTSLKGRPWHRNGHRALMRDINVNGSANVFALARAAGVTRIVHLSSAAVYGAWPDNPPLLDESSPRRAMPGFAYAEDKVAVEDWLDAFEADAKPGHAPVPGVVRLRPHVILGPHAQPLLRWLLRQPFYPSLPDPQPLTQCIWEDDVAEAILSALRYPHSGSFNLAADPPLSFRDMQRARHALALPLPFALARALHRGLWHISGIAGEPGWLEGMRYSLAVDSRRAERELRWRAARSTYECLQRLRAASDRV